MSRRQRKARTARKPGRFVSFLKASYRESMTAGEEMTLSFMELPFNVLARMGVPEARTRGMKDFNLNFVRSVYRGMDTMTGKILNALSASGEFLGSAFRKLKPARGKVVRRPAGMRAIPKPKKPLRAGENAAPQVEQREAA